MRKGYLLVLCIALLMSSATTTQVVTSNPTSEDIWTYLIGNNLFNETHSNFGNFRTANGSEVSASAVDHQTDDFILTTYYNEDDRIKIGERIFSETNTEINNTYLIRYPLINFQSNNTIRMNYEQINYNINRFGSSMREVGTNISIVPDVIQYNDLPLPVFNLTLTLDFSKIWGNATNIWYNETGDIDYMLYSYYNGTHLTLTYDYQNGTVTVDTKPLLPSLYIIYSATFAPSLFSVISDSYKWAFASRLSMDSIGFDSVEFPSRNLVATTIDPTEETSSSEETTSSESSSVTSTTMTVVSTPPAETTDENTANGSNMIIWFIAMVLARKSRSTSEYI